MEGDSESQAQGDVAAGDREGVGNPQGHHQEIHGCRRFSRTGFPAGFSLLKYLIQWRHNKVTFMLNIKPDIYAGLLQEVGRSKSVASGAILWYHGPI